MFHGRFNYGLQVLFFGFGETWETWLEFCALHMHPPSRIPSQLENSANGDWRFLFLFPISLLLLVLMDDLYGFNVSIRERLGGRGVGPGDGDTERWIDGSKGGFFGDGYQRSHQNQTQ